MNTNILRLYANLQTSTNYQTTFQKLTVKHNMYLQSFVQLPEILLKFNNIQINDDYLPLIFPNDNLRLFGGIELYPNNPLIIESLGATKAIIDEFEPLIHGEYRGLTYPTTAPSVIVMKKEFSGVNNEEIYFDLVKRLPSNYKFQPIYSYCVRLMEYEEEREKIFINQFSYENKIQIADNTESLFANELLPQDQIFPNINVNPYRWLSEDYFLEIVRYNGMHKMGVSNISGNHKEYLYLIMNGLYFEPTSYNPDFKQIQYL